MAKLVKLMTYVFAFVGVLVTAGGGYIYATNSELVSQFWAVKDDFRSVQPDRRQEVFAELPARIKFENEVGADMKDLPAERRKGAPRHHPWSPPSRNSSTRSKTCPQSPRVRTSATS